ncbi:hypothetical protein VFPFJ_06582 [Purpureocillium lilacinum]|uniref:Uncharacterized protein n=1 Tax=Purpureocillium lilacinum TaxID=33203 RepID=A0A179HD45_PURLI|nr:hypothetical protein VFPFJ_06582 [Purpureocillium lilacinum]OAQ80474.1 hypothetical protein VFPBJ_06059 [Purpureocillium lilacinum]OAQ88117.1 hypothetical protein VFPFJ_06582 [Purpureocillium lilacinum]
MSLFSMALELALNHQGLPMTTPVRQPCQVESREWLAVLGSPALRKRRTRSNRGGIEWAVPFRGPVLPLRDEARRGGGPLRKVAANPDASPAGAAVKQVEMRCTWVEADIHGCCAPYPWMGWTAAASLEVSRH